MTGYYYPDIPAEAPTAPDLAGRSLRVENRDGYTVGRLIVDYRGRIAWSVVYHSAGHGATVETLVEGIAAGGLRAVDLMRVEP